MRGEGVNHQLTGAERQRDQARFYGEWIQVYTQVDQGLAWLERHRGYCPTFACVLGFTETGLIPGISAAGATPADRRYTAIADAEFLYNGPCAQPRYSLPPLQAGASPVMISRAVLANQDIPLWLFNAGLPVAPAVPCLDLGGRPAACLSRGQALAPAMVEHLFNQGLVWGKRLSQRDPRHYLILAECVVGGTTTAQALLSGLGINATGKINSSHPICNHAQKLAVVQQGLTMAKARLGNSLHPDPMAWVAAVGDPMQITVAGMALAASQHGGVMLAGGTQMLAVFALARAIAQSQSLPWHPENIVVGTTRWVAEDRTGDTVGLASAIADVSLLASQLSFTEARFSQLRAYEQGYVKEGVGAGGCAIAAHLYQNWGQTLLLKAIEALLEHYAYIDQRD